ncbi:SCP2 sterol-binding domain-containing protein [Pelagibius sp. 7325]|uniref:SCP2 sterol-binding domain-containing protein n=1 Tax=Pelagibius sp. 7325 TaxID=3131994 RepID=UPI0030ECE9E9
MSLDTLTEQLKSQAAMNPPLGYRVTFDLGDDGFLLWDGTVTPAEIAAVPEGDGGDAGPEADTVLRLSLDDFGKLLSGTLDPTLAYMTGKLKITGSTGVAMKLAAMLGD